jgi:hypothetical protein
MPSFPSNTPYPELSALFPTLLPPVERLVYDAVKAATEDGIGAAIPALSFYADRERSEAEGLKVPVGLGWPAYPGQVPAIGVAEGPESEDKQMQVAGGGFAGQVTAHDDDGTVMGIADYFSEPLYATIIVELIHENRDERDRLFDELRRLLFPLRSTIMSADRAITACELEGEKTEQGGGPPEAEQPFYVYIGLFTFGIHYEMLEARRVDGPDEIIDGITVDVDASDAHGGEGSVTDPYIVTYP